MKRFVQKVSAVGTSLALLSTGMVGAFAADLGDLPSPFVSGNSVVSAAIVVGNSLDNAAGDVLQDYFTVSGGAGLGDLIQTEEIKLQDNIAVSGGLDTIYDDSDSNIFDDAEVSIGGTSYDYHTEIQLSGTASNFDVETSLTSNDDKYGDDPKLEIKKDAFKYCYVFDENINISQQVSTSNPFEMTFLGKNIRVDTIPLTGSNINTSLTAQVGDSWTGHPGETYVGNGITMEVISVDATSAIVDFGNDQRTVSEGSTISEGEIDVYLDSAIAGVGTLAEATATFVIGEDARVTYKDGDKFPTYCSPSDSHGDPDCDKDNPDWVWDIKGTTESGSGSLNSICIENDFEAFNANKNPAGVGEYYALPDGFAYIGIDSLTVADTGYTKVTLTTDTGNTVDLTNAGNYPSAGVVLTIESDVEEGLTIDQSELNVTGLTADQKTDTIYIWTNTTHQNGVSNTTTIFYVDSNNKVQEAGNLTFNLDAVVDGDSNQSTGTFAYINYGNTKSTDMLLQLFGNVSTDDSLFVGVVPDSSLSSNDNLWFRIQSDIDTGVDGTFQGFGDTDNDEADEVIWGQTSMLQGNLLVANATSNSNAHIGGKDRALRTGYGIIIDPTNTAGDNDQFTVHVPDDQVKANAAIYAGGGAAGSSMPAIVAPSAAGSFNNVVLVGGPCVNSLTAEWMGVSYPSCGTASTFVVDQGMVKHMENGAKTALIVAGWEQADTMRAANKVAAGGLTGTNVLV